MSASTHRLPDSTSVESSASPPTSAKRGRARHARTNASLTSSIGSSSADDGIIRSPIQRRPSAPIEATRIFQATGLDPFGTEPDTLFRSLSVKEVEAYERAVRSTAIGKQQELRALVGQRYEDLLGTANTIIDIAGSSSQLCDRLRGLAQGLESATPSEEQTAIKKASRRKSYLPTSRLSVEEDDHSSSLQQEAIYVLGASLRLIMDAPEYVWKSIERGKTLQAAWAFMITRATWWDLIDASSASGPGSALAADEEKGISSASEAVSLLRINVKKAFPFIEKQWQHMLPLRKQVVSRAVTLLSDAEIESLAVADQLAALMLIDGTKFDQAMHLLLSQRLTAMRRLIHRGRAKSSCSSQADRGPENGSSSRAQQASRTIAQLAILYARTLQHAVQIFLLPAKTEAPTSSQPLLLHLLATITSSANLASNKAAAASPSAERASLLSEGHANRQSAAALRASRRRSSYGLPEAAGAEQTQLEAALDRSQPARTLRVSTLGVVQALPSAQVLTRLLPPSLWSFAPFLDLDHREPRSVAQMLEDLSTWSAKARETAVGASGHAAPDNLRALLSEMSDVSELALLRRSLRLSLHRVRRIVARKLAGPNGSNDEPRAEVVAKVHEELLQLEEAVNSILQERLLRLMEDKLKVAAQNLLTETDRAVSSQRDHATMQSDAPLTALFQSIDPESRPDFQASANLPQSSRAFATALQNHICGRSQQVDRLASLYETPSALIAEDLKVYQEELGADEQSVGAGTSIQASFDALLASSRTDIEEGLTALLNRVELSTEDSSVSAEKDLGGSTPVSLIIRLISVISFATPSKSSGSTPTMRVPVKEALERFWRPRIEQRVLALVGAGKSAKAIPGQTSSSISLSLLSALASLSESILQLGPALAGPELFIQVRSILEAIAASDKAAATDVKALEALLACNGATLSEHLAEDASLHRSRLSLSPLVLALAATANGAQGDATPFTVLSRAEPASAAGHVSPILSLPKKKMERFSALPVR